MNKLSELESALLDLVEELSGSDVILIVGGGFGLYLRRKRQSEQFPRTLIDPQYWPEARATNDLDLFLRPELLIQKEGAKPLAEALAKLGYTAVPGAENYQFVRQSSDETVHGKVKIDLLTGPRASFEATPVKADARRVKPKPPVGLHAHPVDESLTLERGLTWVSLRQDEDEPEKDKPRVALPHPFTFAMMKLFAFRDRANDEAADNGGYHALDLYSVIASMTEPEWAEALAFREELSGHPYIVEACAIVDALFASSENLGGIRLRESPYFKPAFPTDRFISLLAELFPPATT